jgi:hypothetical protein
VGLCVLTCARLCDYVGVGVCVDVLMCLGFCVFIVVDLCDVCGCLCGYVNVCGLVCIDMWGFVWMCWFLCIGMYGIV